MTRQPRLDMPANIPARYVKAKVIVPIDRVKRLVGIDDTLAAVQYLSSAKLLLGSYTTGGVISHVLMEHVYVEAYVPYANYRGTGEDDSGKVWVPLDPGFKQLTVAQEGTDLSTAMGLDWKQFADSYFGAMRNVTPLELYKEKVDQYVSVNHPGKTLDELLRKTEVKTMLFDFLPNSLPYIVQEVTGRFAEIPAEKRYTVRFKMFNNFEYATTLPEVAGRRITLTHAAATPEDQAVINKFGTIFDAPPYAIKLKPQLRVDGMVRAEGTAVQGGSTLGFNVEYTDTAAKTEVLDHKVTSGSYNAVGFTIGKVRPEMASIASVEESAETYLSKMLHSLAMKYHDTANRSRQFLNDSLKVQSRTYITEALVSTRHDIRYVWGIPVSFTMAGYMIDAKEMASGVVPIAGGDRKKIIDFMMLSGLEASYQENRTFEDSMFWLSGYSAANAIPLLKAMGVTIQELEPGTFYVNPALPGVVVEDINNALNMGWKVIVPMETRSLPVTPYIKYDPKTGSAGYMIASAAGGFNWEVTPIGHELDLTPIKNWFQSFMVKINLEIIDPPSPKLVAMDDSFYATVNTNASIGDPATWAYVETSLDLPFKVDTNSDHYSPGHEPPYSRLPGQYTYKFDGHDLLTFQVWNVVIDEAGSDKYLGISTDSNNIDTVPYPLTIRYGMTTFPGMAINLASMRVYDSAGALIRVELLSYDMGTNLTATWDGRNNDGTIVSPGTYSIVIRVVEGAGGTVISLPYSVTVFKLEIYEVNTPSDTGQTANPVGDNSFVAPENQITARARVLGAPQLESIINWRTEMVGNYTGPASPATAIGSSVFIFRATSLMPTTGTTLENPPLRYNVIASITTNGHACEDQITPLSDIRQDLRDIIRQEYVDFGTMFRPTRMQINQPSMNALNQGNYTNPSLIAEEAQGNLENIFVQVRNGVNALLNSDIQVATPGTANLAAIQEVVRPGVDIPNVGPLGNTDPQGDDVCAGPLVNNRCAGAILAGPNGIAETTANNRNINLTLTGPELSSAYRNPQRNRHANSTSVNSRHTRGRAIDIDPDLIAVPGKNRTQLFCLIEYSGDLVVGANNSYTENGPSLIVPCNATEKTHIHFQN